MNDLEIERRIADIEGIHYIETKYKGDGNFLALVSENDFTGTPPEMIGKYNPLTDDALCFRLMIKHGLTVCTYYKIGDETPFYGAEIGLEETEARTPHKAICLAIIKDNES